jgi:hypothetical protein
MKKITFLLFVLLSFGTSCSSDSDDKESLTSAIVVDGISFNPDKGVYFYQTASFESQKAVRFLVSNEKKNENLYIDISFPSTQKDLTGIYDFGPGTADELLVSCELVTAETRYAILGYTLNITELGDSKFSFEFINPEAFDVVKNEKVTFKGGLEGKFEFTEIKE